MTRYFLTDLDGTLLQSDATLSSDTLQTLQRAMAQGIVISYATARSFTSSSRVVSAIPWKYPIVLYNGAALFDPVTGKVIGGEWLDADIASSIIALGKQFGLCPFLFALDADDRESVLHEKLERPGEIQFYASRPNDPRFRELSDLACPASFRTLIVTYIGLLDELIGLKDAVEHQWGSGVHVHFMRDPYIKDHFFLEFSHPAANKKEGLKKWAALVGCQPADITVFGDNLNDLGMFEAAGTKVAVANAHPDLLRIATHVTGSNDDAGVAAYIAATLESSRN
ncbi:haloacid dehalogenase [Paenibacillaceae bacterium]|nr:haloacid dehalogenase [Paenibacillaceae bacterium]